MRVACAGLGLALLLAVGRATETPSTQQLERFLRWFDSVGAQRANVTVAAFPEPLGLGIKATGNVQAGSEILRVPLAAVMSRDTIVRHPSASGARKAIAAEQDDESVIVVFLLLQRMLGEASPWAPYMAVLPEHVPSTLSWSDAELNATAAAFPSLAEQARDRQEAARELASSWVRDTLASCVEALREGRGQQQQPPPPPGPMDGDAAAMAAAARELTGLQLEAAASGPSVMWAQSIVESRALTIRGRKFLVPFADMANHEQHPEPRAQSDGDHFAKHHVVTADAFVVKADRPAAPGAAVSEDYGDSGNGLYVAHHGMVIADNPFDCAVISLPALAQENDAAFEARQAVLSALRVRNPPEACIKPMAPRNAILPPEVTAFLRLRNRKRSSFLKGSACMRVVEAVASKRRPDRQLISECLGGSVLTPAQGDLRRLGDVLGTHVSAVRGLGRLVQLKRAEFEHAAVMSSFASTQLALAEALKSRLAVLAPARERGAARRESPPSLRSKVRRFNDWFRAQGPAPFAVQAKIDKDFRVGAVASRAVAPEEAYLGVPNAAILSHDSAINSEGMKDILARIRAKFPRGDAFHELLFHLIVETKVLREKSFWWPYLDLLPSANETQFPIFWNESDLVVLNGTPIDAVVRQHRAEIAGKFRAIDRAIFQHKDFAGLFPAEAFNEDTYTWAHAILDSRSIWWNGERHLVPMLDLVNCAEGPDPSRVHATNLDDSLQFAITKADRTYRAGDQIFENYGQPNHIYFTYHGFSLTGENHAMRVKGASHVLPANSHDCAQLAYRVPVPSDPKQRRSMQAALGRLDARTGEVTELCISVLEGKIQRATYDTRKALAVLATVNRTLSQPTPTTAEAESRAIEMVAHLALVQLRKMSQTFSASQDELILGSLQAGHSAPPVELDADCEAEVRRIRALDSVARARQLAGIAFRHSQKVLLRSLVPALNVKDSPELSLEDAAEEQARMEEL